MRKRHASQYANFGSLPSGVSKKITPKLYKLKDTEIYIFFSFPPFLFDADNGMIEIKDNKGTFFKKPTQ